MEEGYVNTSKTIVRHINKDVATSFIIKHHYTKKSSSCRYALGLYHIEDSHSFFEGQSEKLIGVMTYGHPVSNRTVASITKEHPLELDEVLELTRLVCLDHYGKNLESHFIGQSFKWLKENAPEVKVLVSYADPEQEHTGTIYRATNWLYQGCGVSKRMPDYSIKLFEDGEWMHSRTVATRYGNKNIENLARRIGHTFWRKSETSKHRYIYFLCGKKEKKRLISDLKIPIFTYKNVQYPEQVIQKVYVKNGTFEKVELLQDIDTGWTPQQVINYATEKESNEESN
jgi:hypothetical protein